MATYLPGRSDNKIKNRWNTHLKKRVKQTVEREQNSTTENPMENKYLEFQQDVLLAESPL